MGEIFLQAGTLWQREIVRFIRQPIRVMSAILTPLVFWLLLGAGWQQLLAILLSRRDRADASVHGHLRDRLDRGRPPPGLSSRRAGRADFTPDNRSGPGAWRHDAGADAGS